MQEIWKPVPGYVGRYEVSNLGRVKSLKGTSKILKPGLRKGYPSITPQVDGVKKNVLIHRWVALVFHGPCPDGYETAHLDGDRLNNCADNLRYKTHAENAQDMVKHRKSLRGTKHHKCRLTEDQVRAARVSTDTCKEIARVYGVHTATIEAIKSGRNWGWLK